jgi:hypothetical protein
MLLGFVLGLLSLSLKHDEKVSDEPMRLRAVGKPIPFHLPAKKNAFHLLRKIGAAEGEELVPDQLWTGVFASVKSPLTIFVTSLLRKR